MLQYHYRTRSNPLTVLFLFVGIMATREETMSKFTVQEGADLKLDCNDDKKLIDLKYQDQTSGLLRIIFTKTTSQDNGLNKALSDSLD